MNEGERNYFKLRLLISKVGRPTLRQLFINQWNSVGFSFRPWTDSPWNGADLLKIFAPSPFEKDQFKSGDTSTWETVFFANVLLRCRHFTISESVASGLNEIRQAIYWLRHTPNEEIQAGLYHIVRDALVSIGATQDNLQEVEKLSEKLDIHLKPEESLQGYKSRYVSPKISQEKKDSDKYTTWFSDDNIERNREANRELFEKGVDRITREKLENAAKLARRFIDEVKCGVDKRRATMTSLRNIADDLDSMSQSAVIIEVAEGQPWKEDIAIFNINMKKTQTTLNEDKEVTRRVDDLYANLRRDVETLSRSNPRLGSKDQIIGLLVAHTFPYSEAEPDSLISSMLKICTLLCSGSITPSMEEARAVEKKLDKEEGSIKREILSRLNQKMPGVFDRGVLEVSGNLVRAVINGGVTNVDPTVLAFDIYTLVDELLRFTDGLKSGAAKALRIIEQRYHEQLTEMIMFIAMTLSLSEDLQVLLKKQSQKILETFSWSNEVSYEQVVNVISSKGSTTWNNAFSDFVVNRPAFLDNVTRICNYLKPKLEEYQKNKISNMGNIEDITFLAHGEVINPLLPCALHYFNDDAIESTVLYVPWGCMLDASAAYGISTGMINTGNVTYDGRVLPGYPRLWNVLPNDYTRIPAVEFTRVATDDSAYEQLRRIDNAFRHGARGLFIPFLPDYTQLPNIPLVTLCTAVAIIGLSQKKKYRIHIASCLNPRLGDETILTRFIYPSELWPTVNCRQYCAVPINAYQSITMSMPTVVVAPELQNLFPALNNYYTNR